MLESLSVDLIKSESRVFCICENCDFESDSIDRAMEHVNETSHVVFTRREGIIEQRLSKASDTMNINPKKKGR